jgi:protein-S-isoprenylcysteine O-methyltransferase Ste14
VGTASSAIKTAIFTLCVPLVVAVWVPQRMLGREHAMSTPLAWQIIGGALFLAGVIGYFWCAALFVKAHGTPAPIFPTQRAVVSGPYRINRNPMYTSVLAVVFGQSLYYGSSRIAWYGAFLFVCVHCFVLLYEEPTLRRQFGPEYEAFHRTVPRWIPRIQQNGRP